MRKSLVISFLIFVIVSLVSCGNDNVYGNTQSEVINYIEKADLLKENEKDNITIVDTTSIDISKVVGFTTNTNRGILVYEKDKESNYVLNQSETSAISENTNGVSSFRTIYKNFTDQKNAEYVYVVISNGEKVAKVEIVINDQYVHSKEIELGAPSMVLLKEKIPEEEKENMKIDIKYYDKDKNEL